MAGKSENTYISESYDTINKIWQENERLTELRFFLDTAYSRACADGRVCPEVVVLGTGIPEELIYAAGAGPYWLAGGSQASTAWSDDLVPRDTDPVSRSILGFVHQPNGADISQSLFIIPLTSDSMRKTAYELKSEGRDICLVDIPPDRSGSFAEEELYRQLRAMTAAVAERTGVRVTGWSVVSAVRRVSRARAALRRFLGVSGGLPDIITESARMLVSGSYYLTDDIDEWTFRLEQLSARVEQLAKRTAVKGRQTPRVLLMGSPVVFPNYKIPFLIRETGLSAAETADSAALKAYISYDRALLRGSRDSIIRGIASVWQRYDASSAFVRNDALFQYVSWLVSRGGIEGVVYHVLKGQIEYDFELERFEKLFSEQEIPVFRLETDYQYQDVEQLRIRLEAFSEMLGQNRYREVKKAL
ncbi:Benzoyl-CoA reductase/2-hydroxyglutaryl-CoA dehydratase subunit, BcrC/BadD/HgdB [Ruminococcus sp. YE71]|uniref:2-hydroxyacyl-CoA dehydratase subunit D n=1 Tax=unclassified Ruminococcus TaxID=2608920 RepID=UPI0008905A3C|nr:MULTISPECIES: 2-hydroxyacyl-CoA dehydratase family protein [unclassified Ruminococcus]SDA19748.1 Benzoyl-CoA reductase/2-hydroxyglutaryl-CoA dehydratase subunit, BcrC/BadD/HgdB [Ruminococcus sp. YE78]SFW31278.1 Benzoyl-CoA reductase/2-hydroxyglutaryl-CoA dehydratase subunit, BcrC/BadD/HgdB [Ruminococcus sp. YE71]